MEKWSKEDDEIQCIMMKRIRNVLMVAARRGYTNLILGHGVVEVRCVAN